MSPPNCKSVNKTVRDMGIRTQTLYNWRSQWQKLGLVVAGMTRPAEQGISALKVVAVIQAAGLNGSDLGCFCRERGPLSQTGSLLAPCS